VNAVREKELRVGFVKQEGFKPGRKREGVMDEQSDETEKKEVIGIR